MVDMSKLLDECIYPKTEEVLYASPDDEVFDAVFLVEFQPDDSGNVPINLYAISGAHGLQVTEHEVEEDDQDYVAPPCACSRRIPFAVPRCVVFVCRCPRCFSLSRSCGH